MDGFKADISSGRGEANEMLLFKVGTFSNNKHSIRYEIKYYF